MAEVLRIALVGAGSTTFGRKDLQRGLEPDKCCYVDCGPSIPSVPIEKANAFLREGWGGDDTTWAESIRTWVRENMARP